MNVIEFEWEPQRRHGWARMVQEHEDGCPPHVLAGWTVHTLKSAKAWAKQERATFREIN